MRAAGGVTCGTEPPTAELPLVRLDLRLVCAARVFAVDLEVVQTLLGSRDDRTRTARCARRDIEHRMHG